MFKLGLTEKVFLM